MVNKAAYGVNQKEIKTEIIEKEQPHRLTIEQIKDHCQKEVRQIVSARRQKIVDMLDAHTTASLMNHGPIDSHGRHWLYSVHPDLDKDVAWFRVHLTKEEVARLVDKKIQRFYLHADATDAERKEREEMLEALVYDENSPLNP